MSKLSIIGLLCLLLAACINLPDLPGSDSAPVNRYMLQGPADDNCERGQTPLGLSIVKVGSGLNTDRIARRHAGTGAFTYLQDVRWVDRSGAMMEQRLARDLECRGFAVITSHHNKLSHSQLVCEVRSLNLVEGKGGDSAEVALSCVHFSAGGKGETALQANHSTRLASWRASDAAAAASASYQQVFADIAAQLASAGD